MRVDRDDSMFSTSGRGRQSKELEAIKSLSVDEVLHFADGNFAKLQKAAYNVARNYDRAFWTTVDEAGLHIKRRK